MRTKVLAVVVLALGFFTCCSGESAWSQPYVPTVSASYLKALRVADEFLTLWIHRNGEKGWPLLSNRAQREIGDRNSFLEYMSGLSNPQHQAFVIQPVGTEPADRYSFPVVIYELANSDPAGFADKSEITVVRENGEWKVDRLPKSPENP